MGIPVVILAKARIHSGLWGCLPATSPPRASPALVSVLWAPLARASLRKRRGRTHPLSFPLDSGLRRNDDAPHPGSFKQPRRARSLLAERFRSRRLVRAGRPG